MFCVPARALGGHAVLTYGKFLELFEKQVPIGAEEAASFDDRALTPNTLREVSAPFVEATVRDQRRSQVREDQIEIVIGASYRSNLAAFTLA